MIGDDDDALWVPNLCILTKLALENAKGARPTDIVRHQFVHRGPDVVARGDREVVRMLGKDLLRHGHRTLDLKEADVAGKNRCRAP